MPLVAPLVSGHSDIAIGSRLAASSRVIRGIKREFVSRGYTCCCAECWALNSRTPNAVSRPCAPTSPTAAATGRRHRWFFDTELLVLAERAGLRIHEVPVDWIDDPDSESTSSDRDRGPQGVLAVGRALASGALPLRDMQAALGREPLVPGVPRAWSASWCASVSSGLPARSPMRCCNLSLHHELKAQAAHLTALLLTALANTGRQPGFHLRYPRPSRGPRAITCTVCWCSRSVWRSPAAHCSCCIASTRR